MSNSKDLRSKSKAMSIKEKKYKISKREFIRLQNLSQREQLREDADPCDKLTSASPANRLGAQMKWPEHRRPSTELTEEEFAAKLEAEHYLARAKQLQLEQEDNVKLANKVILATKCQAIRDAQVSEKQRLLAEHEAEEKRLEAEIEATRLQALEQQRRQREAQIQKRVNYVTTLMEQIDINERQRKQKHENALKEGQKLRELHKQRDREEEEAQRIKMEEQKRVTQELLRMNQALQHRRGMEQAHEKMANLRIQHYMVGKAAREAEREKRRRRLRQLQEREVARLRALQERQIEVRERAFLEAVERDQEMVAKEWRAKELATLRRKAEMEKELQEARALQAAERERLLALELQRAEQQTMSVLQVQQEALAREQHEKDERKQASLRYRQALQQQMLEKEEERRRARKIKEEEARAEQELRNDHFVDVHGVLQLKLKSLRTSKVPEKYVSCVERQMRLLEKNETLNQKK